MASAVMDSIAVREVYSDFPQYVSSIKEKYLARKYVALIKNINKPIRKEW